MIELLVGMHKALSLIFIYMEWHVAFALTNISSTTAYGLVNKFSILYILE